LIIKLAISGRFEQIQNTQLLPKCKNVGDYIDVRFDIKLD
jgi:hypothetical protein